MGPRLISCVLDLKNPQRNALMGLITFWLGLVKFLRGPLHTSQFYLVLVKTMTGMAIIGIEI